MILWAEISDLQGGFGEILVWFLGWFPKLSVLGAESDVDTIELSHNLPPNWSVNVSNVNTTLNLNVNMILGAESNVTTIVSLNLLLTLNINMVILGVELNVNTIVIFTY